MSDDNLDQQLAKLNDCLRELQGLKSLIERQDHTISAIADLFEKQHAINKSTMQGISDLRDIQKKMLAFIEGVLPCVGSSVQPVTDPVPRPAPKR